ncbi:DUF1707 domain-containing protein [Motilibacter aurantiacus]|uniref:DUF1707 domain-containing protein n=1 Tax=Motilibacter aurantiacus TaxID=2714955 RepID=UPI0014083D72|nr:DUF1707 domain-containing protein [Motilibacter aurantiacus]NHC44331.1 DUF1707 domain-containing protein [Motilibacter aurantiacus]
MTTGPGSTEHRPVTAPGAVPELRVGDAERDEVIVALGEHYALGRLTREELDDRQGVAGRARTARELEPLLADLPPLVAARPDVRRGGALARLDATQKAKLVTYVGVNAGLWILWAVLGLGFPWPIFPTVFWGIGLITSLVGGDAGCGASAAHGSGSHVTNGHGAHAVRPEPDKA